MIEILIVDDEELERGALRLIINKGIDAPLEITEAMNGRQAIARASERKPDIVFMDVKMPGTGGIEAAREIRAMCPDVRMVFITAYNQFEYAHEAIRIGVDDYLIKPVGEQRVLELTRSIISKQECLLAQRVSARDAQMKLDALSAYLAGEFLFHVFIRGMSEEKFADYLSILGLNFQQGRALVLDIDYQSYPILVSAEYQRKVLARRAGKLMEALLKQGGCQCLMNFDLSRPFALVCFPFDRKDDAHEAQGLMSALIETIQREVANQLDIALRIWVGPAFGNSQTAPASYALACEGAAGALHAEGLIDEQSLNRDVPLSFADDIKRAVLVGDAASLTALADTLSSWMSSHWNQREFVLEAMQELFAILRHFSHSRQRDPALVPDSPRLLPSHSLEEADLLCRSYFSALFDSLGGSPGALAIAPALAEMRRNFAEDLSLDVLSGVCGLSPSYFSRLFKRVMGMRFVDYLTDIRIAHAQELLARFELNIKQVAETCGYFDPRYFSRVFRRRTGMSPLSYRRSSGCSKDKKVDN